MANKPEVSRLAQEMDTYFRYLMQQPEFDVRVSDLAMIILCQVVRLRAVLTQAGVSSLLQTVLGMSEDRLQQGTAFVDTRTGNEVRLMLAEERDAMEDLSSTPIPDTVPEEWLE